MNWRKYWTYLPEVCTPCRWYSHHWNDVIISQSFELIHKLLANLEFIWKQNETIVLLFLRQVWTFLQTILDFEYSLLHLGNMVPDMVFLRSENLTANHPSNPEFHFQTHVNFITLNMQRSYPTRKVSFQAILEVFRPYIFLYDMCLPIAWIVAKVHQGIATVVKGQ